MSSKPLTGVILSAGKGSRIDPFNTQYPKPLLPIANRPIMGHHIEIFRTLGITDVKIVVGHLMDRIINHFGRGTEHGVHIEYVEQQATLGIAHAVGQLSGRVEGDFLLVLGDIFYAPRKLERMVEIFRAQGGGACLAVMKEPDVEALRKNFSVELSDDGLVKRVIEKPRIPPNDLKGCGLYLFGPEIFDAVRKTPRTALRDEYEITTSIQILIDDGHPVSVADVVEWDFNVTFARDLLDGNLKYLREEGLKNVIDDTAELHPDAVVENSVIGEGVKISVPVRIRNSVILPRARIDRGEDIERCIISPDVWHRC
ncbi:MAG: NTP transferase domain-containing protein [Salinibacterium sp.]|nr:NTP transferase domain-containing protein [Planctomycetota bacterium]MCB1282459.1 NTP transferase domain-containing protein [Salinibacterium sp.]